MNIFSRMRLFSQSTPGMEWMYTLARKTGIVAFVLRIRQRLDPERKERSQRYEAFYRQHEKQFQAIPALLEDELSRRTFERMVDFRRTCNWKDLKGIVVTPQYFQKDIFGPVEDEVFVDGGAYVGDTIESFMKNFAGGGTKNICLGTL